MDKTRTLMKYPNRRLYDKGGSRYITLADIRRLVLEEIDFVVIEKKTQLDVTRSILLQVIAQQENSSKPLLSRDFLCQLIRSYGPFAHSGLGTYLEQSLKQFSGCNANHGGATVDS